MPLKKGKTDKIIGDNISELMGSYKKKGKIGTSKPSSKKKAKKQAVAIALNKAEEEEKKATYEFQGSGKAMDYYDIVTGKDKESKNKKSKMDEIASQYISKDALLEAKKATYCGRCGHTHVKGTACPRPFKKKKKS